MLQALTRLTGTTSGSLICASILTTATDKPVSCTGNNGRDPKPSSFLSMTEYGGVQGLASSLSFGGVAGFSCGFVLKKLGRATVGVFGGLFITFQAASYAGYVSVNWDKVEHDIGSVLDLQDPNGNHTNELATKAVSLLTTNTNISAGCFGAGFFVGLQRG